jgi:methionyl-tRNA formyltransferase
MKKMNTKNVQTVFMGTPEISATVLEQLLCSGFNIAAVFTRTDKPKGRGSAVFESPVKTLAKKHHIPILQPKSKTELTEALARLNPDLVIVVAYGMILSKEAIEIPKLGIFNLHFSLLPKYRGAAPYTASILNGDKKTGVTIMKTSEGLDEGDIVAQKEISLSGKETAPELLEELTKIGGEMLVTLIPRWIKD